VEQFIEILDVMGTNYEWY